MTIMNASLPSYPVTSVGSFDAIGLLSLEKSIVAYFKLGVILPLPLTINMNQIDRYASSVENSNESNRYI